MRKPAIAIVDDSTLEVAQLQDALSKSGHFSSVEAFISAAEFLNDVESNKLNIDAVIIDYQMPVINGLNLVRTLVLKKPPFKILVVSHAYYPLLFKELSALGIRYYCRKTPEVILDSLKKVFLSVNIYQDLNEIDNWEYLSQVDYLKEKDEINWRANLTPLDIKIIRLLSCGYNSKEIGDLLGYESSSIEKYRGMILKSLDLRNSCHLISWAFTYGVVSPGSVFMDDPVSYEKLTYRGKKKGKQKLNSVKRSDNLSKELNRIDDTILD